MNVVNEWWLTYFEPIPQTPGERKEGEYCKLQFLEFMLIFVSGGDLDLIYATPPFSKGVLLDDEEEL